jgi:hypothetical protein
MLTQLIGKKQDKENAFNWMIRVGFLENLKIRKSRGSLNFSHSALEIDRAQVYCVGAADYVQNFELRRTKIRKYCIPVNVAYMTKP